jgi:hypothetical protein
MNHAATAQRRAPLMATLAAGAAILAAGCSVGASSAPVIDSSPTATASTSPAPSVSASPMQSASPSPSSTTAPSPSASLPEGWLSCTNSHDGYQIGYPAGWHTASLNAQEVCGQFHPTAFTVPVDGEYPMTGLNAIQTDEVFDPERSGRRDPAYVRTLIREETTVLGRRAIRFEESLIGEGMYPDGTMRYGYVIDRDGREFIIFTFAVPLEKRYEDWKPMVDQAVETLSFD